VDGLGQGNSDVVGDFQTIVYQLKYVQPTHDPHLLQDQHCRMRHALMPRSCCPCARFQVPCARLEHALPEADSW
jgi:hypothetical protein